MDNNNTGGQRRKIKWQLNIFDVAIIVGAAVAAYLFLQLGRSAGVEILSAGTPTTVRYTVEILGLPEGFTEQIKPGDAIMEIVEKRSVGTVVSVETEPFVMSSKNYITGEYIDAVVPERYTGNLLIESPAMETDETIVVGGGFAVRNGARMSIMGPGYAGAGYIINVERGEG
ncbi:MAG: DUF4330 domain-containing protein [Oscillospiraceae bacterium]|jgi:hypothetical protein|nr:DUF4330 domain-containing protein [Oscillospiraceae bacterium]